MKLPSVLLLALVTIFASGCSVRQSIIIGDDMKAETTFSSMVDDGVAAKLAKFRSTGGSTSGVPANAPLFDAKSISAELAKRPGASVPVVRQDGPNAVSGSVSFRDIRKITETPASGTKKSTVSKAVAITSDGKSGSLSVLLDRTTAKEAFALFPGLDPALIEALAPPALDGQALTESEYVEMLTSVLGSKYIQAVKAAEYVLNVTVPGSITAQTNGTVTGRTVTWKVPVLRLLVLESPVRFFVSWVK